MSLVYFLKDPFEMGRKFDGRVRGHLVMSVLVIRVAVALTQLLLLQMEKAKQYSNTFQDSMFK